jgi:hypothetical protein
MCCSFNIHIIFHQLPRYNDTMTRTTLSSTPLSVHLWASSVCAAAFVSFFLFVSISSFTHSHFPSATSTPLSSSTPSTLTHVDDFVSSSFFYMFMTNRFPLPLRHVCLLPLSPLPLPPYIPPFASPHPGPASPHPSHVAVSRSCIAASPSPPTHTALTPFPCTPSPYSSSPPALVCARVLPQFICIRIRLCM